MRKTGKSITAILIGAAVVLGSTFGCFAAQKTTAEETAEVAASVEIVQDTETALAEAVKEVEAEKAEAKEEIKTDDEVVYVFTDSEGKVEKVMDSIWISNNEDKTQSGNDADLPIGVNLKYYLNGKSISPESLSGKSGHLKVEVLFTNNRYEMKTINGKEEKIYVPFLASAVTALDGEKFTNVTVSNGRVINDGARYAVVGISLPGLKEDLNISGNTVDIPESVTIEADVTDFDEFGLYLLVSNSVFSNLDIDTTEKMETLREDLNKIDDAMMQLINGSDELYNGLVKLAEGADKLGAGVGELSSGLEKIDSNSAALVNGSKEVFNTLLSTASQQLAASGINVGTLTIDNYGTVLTNVVSEGYAKKLAYGKVETAVKENEATIRAAVTEAVNAQVKAGVEAAVREQVKAGVEAAVKEQVELKVKTNEAAVKAAVTEAVEAQVRDGAAEAVAAKYGMTKEEALANPQICAAIDAAVSAKMASDEIKSTIEAQTQSKINELIEQNMASEAVQKTINDNIEAKMNSDEIKATIVQNIDAKMASAEIKALIDQKTAETVNSKIKEYEASSEVQAQISEADKKILDLKASLDNYNKYYQGVIAYTDGVGKASAGAKQLNDSIPELAKGIDALKNGEKKLSDGLNQFNDEGVAKLNDLVNTTLEGMVERFNTVKEVSSDYASYGTDGEAAKDGVRFIYKVKTVR